ncbi:response regulator transcription factor [Desulfosporosinus sp. PR]|uniref:response regulator transcription factor n=1 Tax=Candidatus Desulfosporosinus nitrosoreducens TaxID=3401928 RepID=UPI0027E87E0F|nr:response regulator transcription factor [Desulfosporosinus sp. PR]MDQ7095728.1 response regulator transcription factor [Desulfosporosinus sp. PR]
MAGKILIIDDDEKIRQLIAIYLDNEGLETTQAADARKGLAILEKDEVDLIILDVMMPDMDGIETCLQIRENLNMPIIMVSAKSEDLDKIQGLASGADDYIAKPFNPLELVVRVKAQLRRYKKYNKAADEKANPLEIGDLHLDAATRQVWVDEREVRLTPKEFDILELLLRNKGLVLSTSQIYEAVWRENFFRSNNTVMVHITKIREKIEADPKSPLYIKTIWGVGYKI